MRSRLILREVGRLHGFDERAKIARIRTQMATTGAILDAQLLLP